MKTKFTTFLVKSFSLCVLLVPLTANVYANNYQNIEDLSISQYSSAPTVTTGTRSHSETSTSTGITYTIKITYNNLAFSDGSVIRYVTSVTGTCSSSSYKCETRYFDAYGYADFYEKSSGNLVWKLKECAW